MKIGELLKFLGKGGDFLGNMDGNL